ncbi:hypothetical protein CAPTEDRAFT_160424 [Capitella teleta]|uniref:Glycosyl hydrolase family 13 catalytic domain-containing protein n=1 Tax=Capitella teleta TaxID=283909 RepID=R7UZF1_CAPTE|nr:hypothetical protein CAPTEDRAFT_160424 [Capitella teleta]|eukprot:ELU08811.1 hypothetical protein CAPTEDRAFT_160424 [Capitella teleta]
MKWWQRSVFYQVYPRSFQDSDGDGVGDLTGVISRLDHLVDIGVGAMWLSPFFPSPMVDFGYDVSDYCNIDPVFGSLSDFDRLIAEAHFRDLKVVIDFVPNHTSDQHPWFVASKSSKEESNVYRDYYVWHDGRVNRQGKRVPPNNWVSHFSGSMWTWDEGRQQYYLHQYAVEQPDLNYRNPLVHAEMERVLEFWLERGVDGFRLDAVSFLYEVENLEQDEELINPSAKGEYHRYLHTLTKSLSETHEVIGKWRELLDRYEHKLQKDLQVHKRFMVAEVSGGVELQMPYYRSGAHMPFNFQLTGMNRNRDSMWLAKSIAQWLDSMPDGCTPNWVLGSHDIKRIASKMGSTFINVMNMLLLLLPGVPTTYYGEEIGMVDTDVTYEETQDPQGRGAGKENYKIFSRDPCRSPMQWTEGTHSGFSTAGKTWIPVQGNFRTCNVETQLRNPNSHLNIYKQLTTLRRKKVFAEGNFDFASVNEEILSFIRFHDGERTSLVVANFGKSPKTENFTSLNNPRRMYYPKTGVMTFRTDGSPEAEISLSDVVLTPGEGVVIEFHPLR